ncbi:MAG: trypsin-like peptidase domain-containing protein [Nostoc sp.]|uniref:trypsin-like peptidase domain-containing protein n=1 Tax=Nostoc sp. TaxID=1180 RepID=UPI002FF2FD44
MTLEEEIQRSIVLITSSDPKKNHFGTGFVIRQTISVAHILTCAHVIDDVGGVELVMVDGQNATVVVSGKDLGLDLAILRVEALWDKPALQIQGCGEKGRPVIMAGFQQYARNHLIRSLRGILGNKGGLQVNAGECIPVWDLQVVDDYNLESGYSGSPIVDEATGKILGIVSHKQGGKTGLAISIEALDKIWRVLDNDQLYQVLLNLGYQKQVRTFLRLIERHSIAAFLIHGSPAHGQRWLLNRLIGYVPRCLQGKVVTIGLDRGTRGRDIDALWRELGGRVGLLGGGKPGAEKIAERVYQCWRTQNVFLVFHEVDCMPENYFRQIVQDFWQPLANKARNTLSGRNDPKLLMFLVDYEGRIGNLEGIFSEKLDSNVPCVPVKPPRITQFSSDDLMDWIDTQFNKLPIELTHEVDVIVQEILGNSEDGIPEYVLEQICARCGYNWYEVRDQWLTA